MTGNIAQHFRRLAEQHVHWQSHWLAAELPIRDRQFRFAGGNANDRIRAAFALA